MNETNNQNPRGRGRPLKVDATRTLYLNPETNQIYGKGRIRNGTPVVELTLHRQYNSQNYKHGQTPIISQKNVIIGGDKAIGIPAPANLVNVVVVEPEQEVNTPQNAGVEIPA